MVICIDGKIFSSVPRTLKEFFTSHSTIASSAIKFLKESVTIVDPKFSLYVGQGEYAVIPAHDHNIKVVGSDDATTCHIVILKHPFGTVAVTHVDGSGREKDIFRDIIKEFEKIDHSVTLLDAYVIGGYTVDSGEVKPEKNISEKLSLQILDVFCEQTCTINLQLWCTCGLNTKLISGCSFPHFNGLAISREVFKVFPARFTEQCPNYILRSASFWVNPNQVVANLYDYQRKCVSVTPFYNWNRHYFAYYYKFTDDDILTYFSTSPEVEPPTFCGKLRKVFALLSYSTVESLFPNRQPKTYVINSEGDWEPI